MEPRDLVVLEVPCDSNAPSSVRAALREHSKDAGPVLDDAILVATELVTNAVLHSGCSPNDPLVVRVSAAPDTLRLSVRDPGASGGSASRQDTAEAGGWGLQIVERLTRRWGTERSGGYSVWAELALPVSPSAV